MVFKKYIFIFLFFAAAGLSFSQTSAQKHEIKKLHKEADAFFDYGDYLKAIEVYTKILKIDSLENDANYEMGVCLFKVKRLRAQALRYFEKVHSARFPEANYYLGCIYHHLHNYEKAIEIFKKYQDFKGEKEFSKSEVEHLIRNCDHAMILELHPVTSMEIENMGTTINSPYPDYVPLIPADESFILFTSRRENSTGKIKDAYGDYFEDIYISHFKNNQWQTPVNLDTAVNTNGHDACTGLSADGEKLLVYRTDKQLTGGDIYQSIFNGKTWTRPEILSAEINMPGSIESSACFAPNGETVFFSSDRPGGFGGKDLYMIKKLPNGKWSQPHNLGKEVNTEFDEDAPFVHPNGSILYYSSKGHENMGGYDIFSSAFNESSVFSKTENLGYPLNTADDDIFFVMNTQATTGYFSSEREGGSGSFDLYKVKFGEKNLNLETVTSFLVDEENKPVLFSQVTVIDPIHNKVEGIYKPNHLTGKFVMILEPGKDYTLIMKSEGFEPLTVEFTSERKADNYFKLKKLKQQ